MPSVIQKKSYGSVKVFWLNKDLLDREIEDAVRRLKSEKVEVEEIILFGSYIENKITVSSDIDILIIVRHSDKRFIERPQEFADYFRDIGLNVDLFVYTRQEINSDSPFVNQILAKGKRLA